MAFRVKSTKAFAILMLGVICFLSTSCKPSTHESSPQAVLIYYAVSDEKDLPPPIPFRFILYSDGQAFLFRHDYKDFGDIEAASYVEILTKKLSRSEICALLNSINKSGFFDYDPSEYDFSQSNQYDLVTEYIQVNAWRSKSVELYGLGFAIEEPFVKYKVNQELVEMYNLVNYYPTAGFEPYQPEKLAVWVRPAPGWNDPNNPNVNLYGIWPLESPTLAELAQLTIDSNLYDPDTFGYNPTTSTILEGQSAKAVYDFLGQSIVEWGLPVSENGIMYWVLAIPLLPYQAPPPNGEFYSAIPSLAYPASDFSLSCQLSDGFVEITVP